MAKLKRTLQSKLKEKEYKKIWTDFKPHLYYQLVKNFRIKVLAGVTVQCVERIEKKGRLTDKYKVRIIGIGKFLLGARHGKWRARKTLIVDATDIQSKGK